jgi:hypothetical protein
MVQGAIERDRHSYAARTYSRWSVSPPKEANWSILVILGQSVTSLRGVQIGENILSRIALRT